MKNIVEIYFIVDEVVKQLEKKLPQSTRRGRKNKLTKSELITISLLAHFEAIPTDKLVYERVNSELKGYFSPLPCYVQFTRGIRSISGYLDIMLSVLCQLNYDHNKEGLYIVDSSALPVNGYNQKQCPKWALGVSKGKNIFGFFCGFKLHIIIDRATMKIVSCSILPANIHDVKTLSLDFFIKDIMGTLIGDKGYVARESVVKNLKKQNINLIFKQRNNMDPFLNIVNQDLLRQRQVIEGVFSYLKNRLNMLHAFARSVESFLVHVKVAILAFMLKDIF